MAAGDLTNFENVLQTIHRQYISQPEHEVRRNNEILNRIINQITKEMKDDSLFSTHYNRIFYGGSYFDGLKVGSPEEFDLDFLLKIPLSAKPKVEHSDEPGYLSLTFLAPDELSAEFNRKFLGERNYLSTTKVRCWMKGVFTKALNKFRSSNGELAFACGDHHLKGRMSESGPAVTLSLKSQTINIDIDFVPCFEFSGEQYPTASYRTQSKQHRAHEPGSAPQNKKRNRKPAITSQRKSTFFIVPKSPKNPRNANLVERYWRVSFQEQERELIKDKKTLKPTLKLFKLLRDVLQHKSVASYYIKTIFLWENYKNGPDYWNDTLTNTFFKMFDKYIEYIENGEIPYFWNKKNNLLNVSPVTKDNMVNRLKAIRADVLAKYEAEPLVICKYLDVEL